MSICRHGRRRAILSGSECREGENEIRNHCEAPLCGAPSSPSARKRERERLPVCLAGWLTDREALIGTFSAPTVDALGTKGSADDESGIFKSASSRL